MSGGYLISIAYNLFSFFLACSYFQSSPSKTKTSKPSPKRSKMEFIPSTKQSPPKAEPKVSEKTFPVKTSPVKVSPAKVSPGKVSPKKTETSQSKKPSPVKEDSEVRFRLKI